MNSLWQRFQKYFLRYNDIGFTIDISRMRFADDFLQSMGARAQRAFSEMRQLEAGAIANPDERRMVGHYWLRNPRLAPSASLRNDIEETNARIKKFAAEIHAGDIAPATGKFRHLLVIGIGGSALGPQFVADALGNTGDPMDAFFFDNTDPDGFDRVWGKLKDALEETLVIVISKSGGTKETRNGMVEAEMHYRARRLDFARNAVAVTGIKSELDQHAQENDWLARFPMYDWIGGRTSVMSPVGLLPMALLGFEIDRFLEGAAAMDQLTRVDVVEQNAAMLLALMWFYAGEGQGAADRKAGRFRDDDRDGPRRGSDHARRRDDDLAVAVVRSRSGRSGVAAAGGGVEADPGQLVVPRLAVVADPHRERAVHAPEARQARIGRAQDRALRARGCRQIVVPGADVRGERVVRVLDTGLGHVPRADRLAVITRDLRLEGARREEGEDQPGESEENHQGEHERDAVFVVDEAADSAHGERLAYRVTRGQLRVTSIVITSSRRS